MSEDNTRAAVVTGASSGIGQATALELARRGYQIAIHYCKNEAGARSTFEKVRELPNGQARVYSADLSDPTQANQMSGQILEDFGRVDVLVNNAGSMVERKPLAEMDHELWRRIVGVNLDSVFLVTRFLVPHMISQRSGCIVNVASIAGRNGGAMGSGAYATTKGAIMTLTRAMAREWITHGIRVNCVNPGVIATPFHEKFTRPELFEKLVSVIPRKRAGTSEEVAGAIAFLASDEASYMIGECLEVNGGMLMD